MMAMTMKSRNRQHPRNDDEGMGQKMMILEEISAVRKHKINHNKTQCQQSNQTKKCSMHQIKKNLLKWNNL